MSLNFSYKNICPACNGSGWLTVEDKDGTSVAIRCRCYINRRKEGLLLETNISTRYKHCTFDNFETLSTQGSFLSPTKAQLTPAMAKEVVQEFVKEYPMKKRGLLIIGSCGVGKTHLGVALIKTLIKEKGVPCIFYDFRDLLNEIKASYKSTRSVESSILKPVLEKDVLVLDELGAEKITEWTRDTLAFIINRRYNENLTTIFTSNWLDDAGADEETLQDRIGYRLRSRLYEMCRVIEIVGEDYRKRESFI
ncbi:MAG: ATP-binding protein [bacterium]